MLVLVWSLMILKSFWSALTPPDFVSQSGGACVHASWIISGCSGFPINIYLSPTCYSFRGFLEETCFTVVNGFLLSQFASDFCVFYNCLFFFMFGSFMSLFLIFINAGCQHWRECWCHYIWMDGLHAPLWGAYADLFFQKFCLRSSLTDMWNCMWHLDGNFVLIILHRLYFLSDLFNFANSIFVIVCRQCCLV